MWMLFLPLFLTLSPSCRLQSQSCQRWNARRLYYRTITFLVGTALLFHLCLIQPQPPQQTPIFGVVQGLTVVSSSNTNNKQLLWSCWMQTRPVGVVVVGSWWSSRTTTGKSFAFWCATTTFAPGRPTTTTTAATKTSIFPTMTRSSSSLSMSSSSSTRSHANTQSNNNNNNNNNGDDLFSLSYLQQRMQTLVQKNAKHTTASQSNNHNHDCCTYCTYCGGCRLSIAVAGGGSHFISSLAATPGASAVLLQGTTLYDRESYRRFVATTATTTTTTTTISTATTAARNVGSSHATAVDMAHSSTLGTTLAPPPPPPPQHEHQLPPTTKFRYTSPEASRLAALAALHQALTLTACGSRRRRSSSSNQRNPNNNQNATTTTEELWPMWCCMGLACASALQTNVSTTNTNTNRSYRKSRAFITASDATRGLCVQISATLMATPGHPANTTASATTTTTTTTNSRTRWQEDVVVSHAMLTCLEYALQVRQDSYGRHGLVSSSKTTQQQQQPKHLQDLWTQRLQTRQRQQQEQQQAALPALWTLSSDVQIVTRTTTASTSDDNNNRQSKFLLDDDYYSDNSNSAADHDTTTTTLTWSETSAQGDQLHVTVSIPTNEANTVVQHAIHDIQAGHESTVLLLPQRIPPIGVPKDDSDEIPAQTTTITTFQRLATTVLPPHSLIFPGSFNPPHVGHIQLVQAALEGQQQELQSQNGQQQQQREESKSDGSSSSLSTTDDSSVAWFELSVINADKPPLEADVAVQRLQHFLKLDIPFPWGIILTSAPLFFQKVALLQPLQVSCGGGGGAVSLTTATRVDKEQDHLAFCIGTDTLVRLLNAKYYNNSTTEMLQALQDMPCHFYVGGRLEQGNTNNKSQDQEHEKTFFVTGQEQLEALPPHLQSKFTLLKDFRVDISSTEIRRQQQQQHGQSR